MEWPEVAEGIADGPPTLRVRWGEPPRERLSRRAGEAENPTVRRWHPLGPRARQLCTGQGAFHNCVAANSGARAVRRGLLRRGCAAVWRWGLPRPRLLQRRGDGGAAALHAALGMRGHPDRFVKDVVEFVHHELVATEERSHRHLPTKGPRMTARAFRARGGRQVRE